MAYPSLSSSTENPKKIRVRRACDLCNFKRSKCEGGSPCLACGKSGKKCTYLRQEKKRGRASEKYPKNPKTRRLSPKSDLKKLPIYSPGYDFVDCINAESSQANYVILEPLGPLLDQLRLPSNVASDLLEYYFSELVTPSLRPSCVLRKRSLLSPEPRATSPALILAILALSCFDASHFFLTGHRRKQLFNALVAKAEENIKINSQSPDKISGDFDDVLVCLCLTCTAPLVGPPSGALLWLRRAIILARDLRINLEPSAIESGLEPLEERRRCWWTLYVLDKHFALALNTESLISDAECTSFHPCSDLVYNDVSIARLPSPHEEDRLRGVDFTGANPGFFGWMLRESIVVGTLLRYKSRLINRESLDAEKEWIEVSLKSLFVDIKPLKAYCKVDYQYACVLTCVLELLLSKGAEYWQLGMLRNGIDVQSELQWCLKYKQVFKSLLDSDPDMRNYPLLIRLYIFFACVDVINLLHHMDQLSHQPDFTLHCSKVKGVALIMARCVESCMTTLPADYLRTVRNVLMEALRDVEWLAVVEGFEAQFVKNREKRKKVIDVYSYVVNGCGIGL